MASFDFNKTVDCADQIKYILENFEQLRDRLAPRDWQTLQSALSIIKVNTMSKILETQLENSEEIGKQIEEAKSLIEARIAKLEKEKDAIQTDFTYDPYVPTETGEKVITAFKDHVDGKHKRQYEAYNDAKIQQLKQSSEREISRLTRELAQLEQTKSKLEDPKAFLEEFIKEYFYIDDLHVDSYAKRKFQELIDICAMNMAYGYCEMESSRVSVEKDGKELWDVPIFTNPSPYPTSSGYKINPEALKSFLDLIRDEPLCRELGEYDSKLAELTRNKELEEIVKKTLSDVNDKLELLEDKDLCAEVETTFSEACKLIEESEENSKQIRESNLPVARNWITRAWAFITGSAKKAEQQQEELKQQKADIEARKKTAYENYSKKAKEDPRFAFLSKLYYDAYRSKNSPKRAINFNSLSEYEFFAKIDVFSEKNKENNDSKVESKSKSDYIIEKLGLKRKKSDLEADDKRLSGKIAEQEIVEREAYEALSPEIKKVLSSAPNHRIPMSEIIHRYIEPNGSNTRRDGVSPFVASLVLEALFNMKDIKTAQDAERYGISLDMSVIEEDVNEAKKIFDELLDKHFRIQETEETSL